MANHTIRDSGLEYSRGITGKYLFRVRETYVAGPVADLIRSHRAGAVKLDLVLRGLGLSPDHAGKRQVGLVLRQRGLLSYNVLHDLCRARTDQCPVVESVCGVLGVWRRLVGRS